MYIYICMHLRVNNSHRETENYHGKFTSENC